MTSADIAFNSALLDSLLPGDGNWPAASATDAVREFAARIAADAPLAASVALLRAHLPADFVDAAQPARDRMLQAFEIAEGAHFAVIATEAFGAYYMDEAAMAHLRLSLGYSGRPPQPGGRDIPPFDPAILPARRIAAKEL
jgi:hypothetical protein